MENNKKPLTLRPLANGSQLIELKRTSQAIVIVLFDSGLEYCKLGWADHAYATTNQAFVQVLTEEERATGKINSNWSDQVSMPFRKIYPVPDSVFTGSNKAKTRNDLENFVKMSQNLRELLISIEHCRALKQSGVGDHMGLPMDLNACIRQLTEQAEKVTYHIEHEAERLMQDYSTQLVLSRSIQTAEPEREPDRKLKDQVDRLTQAPSYKTPFDNTPPVERSHDEAAPNHEPYDGLGTWIPIRYPSDLPFVNDVVFTESVTGKRGAYMYLGPSKGWFSKSSDDNEEIVKWYRINSARIGREPRRMEDSMPLEFQVHPHNIRSIVNPPTGYEAPTGRELDSPAFHAIWAVIKDWDINVPNWYDGYTGAMGNHVIAIMNGIRQSLL